MRDNNIGLILLLLIFTSCNLNYSVHNDIKLKAKKIDGVEYRFTNMLVHKKIGFSFFKNKSFYNEISFYGMGRMISKKTDVSDFEKRLNTKKINLLRVDSVNFSVNKNKDKIDLIYYLNLFDNKETVTFIMSKNENKWELE